MAPYIGDTSSRTTARVMGHRFRYQTEYDSSQLQSGMHRITVNIKWIRNPRTQFVMYTWFVSIETSTFANLDLIFQSSLQETLIVSGLLVLRAENRSNASRGKTKVNNISNLFWSQVDVLTHKILGVDGICPERFVDEVLF